MPQLTRPVVVEATREEKGKLRMFKGVQSLEEIGKQNNIRTCMKILINRFSIHLSKFTVHIL